MLTALHIVDLLFALGVVSSLGLCWLAYHSHRQWNEPGVRPFAAFALILGLGGVVGGIGSIIVTVAIDSTPLWTQSGFVVFFFSAVLWGLFGLQYTGRYTRLEWRTVGWFFVPIVVLIILAAPQTVAGIDVPLFEQFVGGAVFLYVLFLLGLGAYLVVQTTHAYGHLSIAQGGLLAAAPIAHFLLLNAANPIDVGDDVWTGSLFVLAYTVPLVALWIGVYRYETFESTPAAGTIGERAIAEETDDLVFVVDRRGRLITLNETVVETLGVDRNGWLGAPLDELLDRSVDELREKETVTIETIDGTRRYDPAVSQVADQHDRPLGWMLGLRDVTDREIRKQRLEVLNRILRHNLRNRVSVIKGNAEFVAEELTDDELVAPVETTIEAADSLTSLGQKAKTIEELLGNDRSTRDVDLRTFFEEVRSDAETQWPEASISIDAVDRSTAETDPAVLRFVVETLLENAIEHSDRDRPTVTISATVEATPVENSSAAVDDTMATEDDTGTADDDHRLTIEIADDGPGIPDGEIEVIRKGTETPLEHGSGLGLWVVHWAVTDLGGDLSFRDRDPRGSVVVVELPTDRG